MRYRFSQKTRNEFVFFALLLFTAKKNPNLLFRFVFGKIYGEKIYLQVCLTRAEQFIKAEHILVVGIWGFVKLVFTFPLVGTHFYIQGSNYARMKCNLHQSFPIGMRKINCVAQLCCKIIGPNFKIKTTLHFKSFFLLLLF